jgi:hypothetical protein
MRKRRIDSSLNNKMDAKCQYTAAERERLTSKLEVRRDGDDAQIKLALLCF